MAGGIPVRGVRAKLVLEVVDLDEAEAILTDGVLGLLGWSTVWEDGGRVLAYGCWDADAIGLFGAPTRHRKRGARRTTRPSTSLACIDEPERLPRQPGGRTDLRADGYMAPRRLFRSQRRRRPRTFALCGRSRWKRKKNMVECWTWDVRGHLTSQSDDSVTGGGELRMPLGQRIANMEPSGQVKSQNRKSSRRSVFWIMKMTSSPTPLSEAIAPAPSGPPPLPPSLFPQRVH